VASVIYDKSTNNIIITPHSNAGHQQQRIVLFLPNSPRTTDGYLARSQKISRYED